jgi:isopentenyl-diphosphate delta-isomerase
MKDLHIETCLRMVVESKLTTGLETVLLEPGLPEFDIGDVDTTCHFLGKPLSLPLLIAPITGGGRRSARINRNLATAAEQCAIGMAVGSVRPMLEGKASAESYMLREFAPNIPILANLGLMHARRGRDYLLEAVESISADGLTVYVNPLHEILQQDGEADFRGTLEALAAIAGDFPYPIFLKEVGFGLSDRVLTWASRHPVAGVDVAGLGGTNWAKVEGLIQGKDYSVYEGLGKRTLDAILAARKSLGKGQVLIASGGIRTGVDMAKAFALGAHYAAMALPFLKWGDSSADDVVEGVERLRRELSTTLWYCGCRKPTDLKGKSVQDPAA